MCFKIFQKDVHVFKQVEVFKIDRGGWEEEGCLGLGVGEKSLVLTVKRLSEAMWPAAVATESHWLGTDLSTSHSNSWKRKKQKFSQAFRTTPWVGVLWSSPTDEDYEAKRGVVTCPRSHNWESQDWSPDSVSGDHAFLPWALAVGSSHQAPSRSSYKGSEQSHQPPSFGQTSAFSISDIIGSVLLVPLMQRVGSDAPFD